MKQIADWYKNRPKRVTLPAPTVVVREDYVERWRVERWRAERLEAERVTPVSLEGTFISRLVPDPQGTTLVLGFAEHQLQGRMYGVNLISKNPIARGADDHGTSPFIGRRCRVTIEVLE